MTYSVTVTGKSRHLTEEMVRDAIDLWYEDRGTDGRITVTFNDPLHKRAKWDGLHCYNPLGNHHQIDISDDRIEFWHARGKGSGGNKSHTDIRAAVMSVLAHEIAHANQATKMVAMKVSLSREGRYRTRANEVDARQFADQQYSTIREYFGL